MFCKNVAKPRPMRIPEARYAVLKYLYDGYQYDPCALHDVTDIIKQYGEDPCSFGKYLAEEGYVRNMQYKTDSFLCQITWRGIEEIAPDYIRQMQDKVVSTLGTIGGRHRLLEVLGLPPEHFFKAFDLAKYLESHGVIYHPSLDNNDVIIQLTEYGKLYFEGKKWKAEI